MTGGGKQVDRLWFRFGVISLLFLAASTGSTRTNTARVSSNKPAPPGN
jgi:hypothetical protein